MSLTTKDRKKSCRARRVKPKLKFSSLALLMKDITHQVLDKIRRLSGNGVPVIYELIEMKGINKFKKENHQANIQRKNEKKQK